MTSDMKRCQNYRRDVPLLAFNDRRTGHVASADAGRSCSLRSFGPTVGAAHTAALFPNARQLSSGRRPQTRGLRTNICSPEGVSQWIQVFYLALARRAQPVL